jgi:hypothetical protein
MTNNAALIKMEYREVFGAHNFVASLTLVARNQHETRREGCLLRDGVLARHK